MKKMIMSLAAVAIGLAITVSSATASPASDALGACFADNTTGKDRKDLARWFFVVMSAHPEIHNLSNVTEKYRDELDMTFSAMVTRLIIENCPAQAKTAMKEGGEAFQTAFSVLGKLAMQELMSNPEVNSSISRYAKYIDRDKVNSVLSDK